MRWIAGIAVALMSVGMTWYFLTRPAKTPSSGTNSATQTSVSPSSPSQKIRIAAMGDMLAHDSVVSQAKIASGYNFTPYFSRIRPVYTQADVVFCNTETLSSGTAFGISGYPSFNAPTEFADGLTKGAGCNVINLATNHIADKGQLAINATLDNWQSQHVLAYSGANRSSAEQNTVRYFTKNGLKVAFIAFADFSNVTVPASYSLNNYHDTALVKKLLTEARANADVVIVSTHWGTEDSNIVNTDQQQAAKQFAELGADVVIGTGPHVVQRVSWLDRPSGGKTLVWYSIGNMLSSQLKTDELTGGVAGFTVTKQNGVVSITDMSFVGTFMSYEWSAADRAASNLAARHNLLLQPLAEANDATAAFGTTVAERSAYLHRVLGNEVQLAVTP